MNIEDKSRLERLDELAKNASGHEEGKDLDKLKKLDARAKKLLGVTEESKAKFKEDIKKASQPGGLK